MDSFRQAIDKHILKEHATRQNADDDELFECEYCNEEFTADQMCDHDSTTIHNSCKECCEEIWMPDNPDGEPLDWNDLD